MDLQIKIVTMDQLTCNIMFIVSNITFIVSLFLPNDSVIYFTLLIFLGCQAIELSLFIYLRAKQITTFLGIQIFCVKNNAPLV